MLTAALLCLTLGDIPCVRGEPMQFRPGDADRSGAVNGSDPQAMLNYLYYGTSINLEASDVNGDEDINNSDPVYLLAYLYQGGPPPVLGTGLVVSCQQAYLETFGSITSTRALTWQEQQTVQFADAQYTALKNLLNSEYGLAVPKMSAARIIHVVRPEGWVEMTCIPVHRTLTTATAEGAIYLHRPGVPTGLAMAGAAGPAGGNPRFFLRGPNAADLAQMNFDANMKFLGADPLGGAGATLSWEDFKEWLGADNNSPAEDLPWWVDWLCGVACGDAIFVSHNPFSISACIHCLGLYISACVPANPT